MSKAKDEGMNVTSNTEDGEIGSMVTISSIASQPASSYPLLDITQAKSLTDGTNWEGEKTTIETVESLSTTGKEQVESLAITKTLHQPSDEVDLPPGSRDSLVEETRPTSTGDSVLDTTTAPDGVNFSESHIHATTPPQDSRPIDSYSMSNYYPSTSTVRSSRLPSFGDDAVFQMLHRQDSQTKVAESSTDHYLTTAFEEKKDSFLMTESDIYDDAIDSANDAVKTVLSGQLPEPSESLDESESYYSLSQSEPSSPATANQRNSPKRSYAEWRQLMKGRPSPTARSVARKFSNGPAGNSSPSLESPLTPMERETKNAEQLPSNEMNSTERLVGVDDSRDVHHFLDCPDLRVSTKTETLDSTTATEAKHLLLEKNYSMLENQILTAETAAAEDEGLVSNHKPETLATHLNITAAEPATLDEQDVTSPTLVENKIASEDTTITEPTTTAPTTTSHNSTTAAIDLATLDMEAQGSSAPLESTDKEAAFTQQDDKSVKGPISTTTTTNTEGVIATAEPTNLEESDKSGFARHFENEGAVGENAPVTSEGSLPMDSITFLETEIVASETTEASTMSCVDETGSSGIVVEQTAIVELQLPPITGINDMFQTKPPLQKAQPETEEKMVQINSLPRVEALESRTSLLPFQNEDETHQLALAAELEDLSTAVVNEIMPTNNTAVHAVDHHDLIQLSQQGDVEVVPALSTNDDIGSTQEVNDSPTTSLESSERSPAERPNTAMNVTELIIDEEHLMYHSPQLEIHDVVKDTTTTKPADSLGRDVKTAALDWAILPVVKPPSLATDATTVEDQLTNVSQCEATNASEPKYQAVDGDPETSANVSRSDQAHSSSMLVSQDTANETAGIRVNDKLSFTKQEASSMELIEHVSLKSILNDADLLCVAEADERIQFNTVEREDTDEKLHHSVAMFSAESRDSSLVSPSNPFLSTGIFLPVADTPQLQHIDDQYILDKEREFIDFPPAYRDGHQTELPNNATGQVEYSADQRERAGFPLQMSNNQESPLHSAFKGSPKPGQEWSAIGDTTSVATNISSVQEPPNSVSQESRAIVFDADPWHTQSNSYSAAQSSSGPPGKPFHETILKSQSSLSAFDTTMQSDANAHGPSNNGIGVIGKPMHLNESLSTHSLSAPVQTKQNETTDPLALTYVPPYAIVAQETQPGGKRTNQQEMPKQYGDSVGASADSYFSYQLADQPPSIAVASLPKQPVSSQGLSLLDGNDLGEQSFGPTPSQRSMQDAFVSLPPGESFGYSYESEKNSPLAEDDAPQSPSQGWKHSAQDNKVGNVIIVPRPARMDGPVAYTAPAHQLQQNPYHHFSALALPLPQGGSGAGGRRKIKLKLQEDVKHQDVTRRSFFFRKKSVRGFGRESIAIGPVEASVDRGTITVSWYDGTTSLELQEHVRRSVVRKLGLDGNTRIHDIRILDESVDPPEGNQNSFFVPKNLRTYLTCAVRSTEIVLSPFIPDGSRFLLRFSTRDENETGSHVQPKDRWSEGAPESPGASPSPYPSSQDLAGLNATQLALLASRWNPLNNPAVANGPHPPSLPAGILKNGSGGTLANLSSEDAATAKALTSSKYEKIESKTKIDDGDASSKMSAADTDDDILSMQPDDLIEERLRKITELLLLDRRRRYSRRRQEKRQVIFVLANYFVLFLSLIAISAEIQARAPNWLAWLERELASVQQCATDQDALFNCVSNGDFAGLIASVVLWLSRSASTKRIFLFGFKSPKQLWTVVYEALVTGVCWGFSYLFIRRAMNPETRKNYFQKYWKDAVYGSLAGFNAAFMKHVLKNLIPQERFEEALQQKQLNIFSWFPSVIKK
jgi:hypothetical protein